MEMFNEWLQKIQESGLGEELYYSTGTVCTILMILAIIGYTWRHRLNPIKTLIIGCSAKLFLVYAQYVIIWYRHDFTLDNFFDTDNIAYAFLLLPIFCWLCDVIFNMPKGTAGELVAISTLAWHWVGRSGCTFAGCCHGIPCRWGIYSYYVKGNTFPVCWVESLIALSILIFLLIRFFRRGCLPYAAKGKSRVMQRYLEKRRQHDDGRALPYMLLFYGVGRFFTEFLRYHPTEDVLFGFLPEFSIHALLMATVGGFLLFRIARKSKAAEVGEDTLPQLNGQRK